MARIRCIKPETPAGRWQQSDLRLTLGTTALYRMWDDSGALLYIGITGNPVERWRSHAQRKPWWPEVSLITWEEFAKEYLALNAERTAIRIEMPCYNIRSVVASC